MTQVNLFAVSQSLSLDTVFNCSQYLQEIAHEQNFEVTWVDIDEKTTESECRSDVDGGSYRAPLGLYRGVAWGLWRSTRRPGMVRITPFSQLVELRWVR